MEQMASPAARYEIERTWRQLRNGGRPVETAAAGTDDGQLSVGGSLKHGQLIQPGGYLVQDEKSDSRRDPNVADEPAHRIEQRRGN